MVKLDLQTPADPARWTGRVDDDKDRDAFRWHQVVECLDLSGAENGSSTESLAGFCLLGYCCDAGVALNLGRAGAARGPEAIRRQLANLPVNFPDGVRLCDGGDIHCVDGEVEASQRALAALVERSLASRLLPIVLGGGHDVTFGHYLGLRNALPASTRLGIVSFDAHLDLRPLRPAATSGTMFTQIAADCRDRGTDFRYLCVGVQRSANTVSLFRTADALGVEHVLAKDMDDADLESVRRTLDGFLGGCDVAYVTVCADVFSSAFAPGVSAPQPFGLQPETVLRLFKHTLASGKIVGFDIAEVSPRFDNDDRTAKLAAIFVYALVNEMSPSAC